MASFQQTDTAGTCATAAFCTGNAVNSNTYDRQASEGGTAGSGSLNLTIDGSANNLNAVTFTIIDGMNNLEDLDGATGLWTFRYNVTAARSEHSWTGAAACRVNSSCVNQETICDDQTFSVSLGSTGVKSQTVNQASAITMGATDLIAVVYAFDSSTASPLNHIGSPTENIDNQWAAGGGGGRIMSSLAGEGGLAGPGGIAGPGGGLAG